MNEQERQGDPAFDRLMAADPARRAPDPVQGVLRAKVDALIAEQAEGEPAARGLGGRAPAEREATGHDRGRDDLAVRRHRRRAPWLVAAAVAGIVAAGGGGYVAGERGLPVSTADTTVESGVQPFDAPGDLPEATGFVFHAGAALSTEPGTAQVRLAEEGSPDQSLGAYPVVSEVEAVERLGDPRFSGAVLGRSGQAGPSEGAGPRTVPESGGPIAWPVEDVTIVSATLTEVRYPADGAVLLVPAYDLTDTEGGVWTVMAVDEELLDFTP